MENDNLVSKLKYYLPFIVPVSCFILLYHDVILHMVQDWQNDPDYSHGFLIPIISGYLIWAKRNSFQGLTSKTGSKSILLVILSLLFFIIAHTGAELFMMRFSMVLVILSAIVFLAGWAYTKALLVPVFYLIFMIPLPSIIWNKIAFPLKLFATGAAVRVIAMLGITVHGEGNIIYLENTTLEVVDACSGLRSLTSLLALSAAFAIISDHAPFRKWVLFLSAVPIAIATNISRLSVTAVLAKHFGPQVAQGFLHEASGIVIFFFAMILLYLVNKLLTKSNRNSSDPSPA